MGVLASAAGEADLPSAQEVPVTFGLPSGGGAPPPAPSPASPGVAGPAAAGPGIAALTQSMLQVVSEKTGYPVEMLELHPDGSARTIVLGPDPRTMRLQHVVAGGVWQGTRLVEGGRFALMGCTVAPGFDYADYEAGTVDLVESWPGQRDRILDLLGD